jgi:hypothetical protein
MILTVKRAAKAAAAVAIPASLMIAGAGTAAAAPAWHHHGAQLTVKQILNGMKLHHRYIPAGSKKPKTEPLTLPDDITSITTSVFTAFQNGVGPQGQPSTDGNTDSTVVEFGLGGQEIHQWDVHGKCDGLTADPATGMVIATVNEDANSSLYTINPEASSTAAAVQHYAYNKPLPSKGGTDAISFYNGQMLISASAPGTTGKPAPQPTYPAVYRVTLNSKTHIATIAPLFFDEAVATIANRGSQHGKKVKLALTDPDSNEVVPAGAPRYAGQFMETSQGDKEQIFVKEGKTSSAAPKLRVLNLSNSVDDTAWPVGPPNEILFAADTSGDTIDTVTGTFPEHSVITAVTPCDANNAPPTCPGPGFPPNYVGVINPFTGHISKLHLSGPRLEPQGMHFVAAP